jgi:hypothetical protein
MRAATSEFGTSETSTDVRSTAAIGGKADISQRDASSSALSPSRFGVCRHRHRHRRLREPLLIGGLGVAFDFLQAVVAADARDLKDVAADFREPTTGRLAQSVEHARVRQSGLVAGFAEPRAEGVVSEPSCSASILSRRSLKRCCLSSPPESDRSTAIVLMRELLQPELASPSERQVSGQNTNIGSPWGPYVHFGHAFGASLRFS